MTYKHLQEQVELLREHLEMGNPSPEFIERHALTIIELAKDLPQSQSLWNPMHSLNLPSEPNQLIN